MESSKEKIEAQLCAYVEGELDDAERAEIEQHLAANPQHQALIAELRVASGLLRDLPRVASPVELNEGLCGQLERGALLDPSDDGARAARRVNRWPQLTAVAAVLILAVGLGLVIYYVLPPAGGTGKGPVALDEKAIKESNRAIDSFAKDQDGDRAFNAGPEGKMKEYEAVTDPDAKVRRRIASGATTGPASYSDGVDSQGRSLGRDDGATFARRDTSNSLRDLDVARAPGLAERKLVTPAEVENVRKWMKDSLGSDSFFRSGGNTSLYLVVSTPNASVANGQLAAYFKDNGIQYMADDTRGVATFDAPATRGMHLRGADGALAFNAPAPAASGPMANPDPASSGGRGGLSYGGGSSSGGFGGGGGGSAGRAPVAAPAPSVPALQPAESKDDLVAAKPDFSAQGLRKAGAEGPKDASVDQGLKQEASKSSQTGSLAEVPNDGSLEKQNVGAKKEIARNESAAPERSVADASKDLSAELQQRYALGVNDKASANRVAPGNADRRAPAPAPTVHFGVETAGTATPSNPSSADNVIIARMNRRQLNEISAALSREQGQRAELKEFAPAIMESISDTDIKMNAPTAAAVGEPHVVDPAALTLGSAVATPNVSAAPGGGAERTAAIAGKPDATSRPAILHSRAASDLADHADALRLKLDPLDEPVDVVIVIKPELPK